MRVPLPANLDIDAHIIRFPPIAVPGFLADKLVYILSLLITIPANDKRIRKEREGWIPLNSSMLARRVKDYKPYLKYALGLDNPDENEAAIILTDNHFITGEKSRYYRYVEVYSRNRSLKAIEITSKTLRRQEERYKFKREEGVRELYPYLVKWFNPRLLKIDVENATNYSLLLKSKGSEDQFADWVQMMNSPAPVGHNNQKVADLDLQHQTSVYNINRIAEGAFFFNVDDNVRRFHSNLSNLKSELRNFLTYDGKLLVNIDINNSQPFLSLALFDTSFLEHSSIALPADSINFRQQENNSTANTVSQTPQDYRTINTGLSYEHPLDGDFSRLKRDPNIFHLSNVAPEIFESLKNHLVRLPLLEPKRQGAITVKSIQISLLASLITLSKVRNNSTNTDKVLYRTHVSSGRFYEAMIDEFRQRLGKENVTRKEAKIAVFLILFTKNNFINNEEAAPKRMFREIYPTVYDYFSRFKTSDSTTLPRLLQSIESWLILDVVCRRISSEKPSLPIFTIHDSILTTSGDEEYVKQVLEEEIERHMKIKPTLEITHYNSEVLIQELIASQQET